MAQTSGIFITFEGTEGAGKSTLMREVARRLREAGHDVIETREPGGTPVAEKIREVILGHGMNPWTELFLYEAARAEHLATTVEPALARGAIVLCDRFTDSTLAYQAHARGLPWKDVAALNRAATRGLKPHLTVLLDLDPAEGLKRAQDPNRFEAEGVAFQARVRQGFLRSRKLDPKRWFTLRSDRATAEANAGRLVAEIDRRFAKKKSRRKKRK